MGKQAMVGHYSDTYGTWKVTTEGDSEGRSVRDLGVHVGHIDEIAFELADKCTYSLRFKAVDCSPTVMTPKAKSVNISFDIDSGTWDKSASVLGRLQGVFRERPVSVSNSNFHSAYILRRVMSKEERRCEIEEKLSAAGIDVDDVLELFGSDEE